MDIYLAGIADLGARNVRQHEFTGPEEDAYYACHAITLPGAALIAGALSRWGRATGGLHGLLVPWRRHQLGL